MSTPSALTVLRAAVAAMEPGELYLEVGSYRGRSLVGALAESDKCGVAVENFSEFPESASEASAELAASLIRWKVDSRVTVLDGDAFELLPRVHLPAPVGVYFYDGVHSGWAQYAALGIAERLLADRAVVIIDDATWPQVAQATDSYLARHSGYQLIADYRALSQDDPVWCNGLRVYAWRRPASWSPSIGRDVAWRAHAQRRIDSPLRSAAWSLLSDHPRSFNAVRTLVTRGATQVTEQHD
ncbi:MAG: class I SAM-dependent methyltransferase [Actinobacteria bacterium]|nr:class I SAM-dependent methyltransferase [Actinomycetota bacterium]